MGDTGPTGTYGDALVTLQILNQYPVLLRSNAVLFGTGVGETVRSYQVYDSATQNVICLFRLQHTFG